MVQEQALATRIRLDERKGNQTGIGSIKQKRNPVHNRRIFATKNKDKRLFAMKVKKWEFGEGFGEIVESQQTKTKKKNFGNGEKSAYYS